MKAKRWIGYDDESLIIFLGQKDDNHDDNGCDNLLQACYMFDIMYDSELINNTYK